MPRKRAPRVRYCEFCGHPFGIERGPAAKTCSPECERDRNNAKEKARYQRVKDTPEWRATRADYLGRVKERAARDPEFAERLQTKLDELHEPLLQRYRDAGLPMDELQAWQIVEIALNELLQSVRKNQARQRSGS